MSIYTYINHSEKGQQKRASGELISESSAPDLVSEADAESQANQQKLEEEKKQRKLVKSLIRESSEPLRRLEESKGLET